MSRSLTTQLSRCGAALRRDTMGGILLLVAAAVALALANSPWADSYQQIREVRFGPAALGLNLSVQQWAADGLLALFFFLVGNELQQEFVHGQFRDPRQALMPLIAAVTGALLPAAIFLAVNLAHPEFLRGWGVPMATDPAFAVPVLAVIGRHLPLAVRTTLLTLAVVDDLIAIIVLAVFYATDLAVLPLAAALAGLALFGYLQRGRGLAARLTRTQLARWVLYLPLVTAIWACMHASGIHATIAGAALGLLMRTRTHPGEPCNPSLSTEHLLRPATTAVALPVFAFTSAGVTITANPSMLTNTITVGVITGLVVGKLVGITGGAWLATRLTRARLDPNLRWIDIIGMSQLAGIGFTVSLLFSELSYPDPTLLDHAKTGVLLGSLLAGTLGAILLSIRNTHYRTHPQATIQTRPGDRSSM